MDQVPVTHRTRLLSDNGPGHVSRASGTTMHILATSFHPQTNGKLERYHQTLKRDVNQVPYELPADLEAARGQLLQLPALPRGSGQRDPPSDVLKGRREEILQRRKEGEAPDESKGEDATTGPSGSSPDLHPAPDLSGNRVSDSCWLLTFVVPAPVVFCHQ